MHAEHEALWHETMGRLGIQFANFVIALQLPVRLHRTNIDCTRPRNVALHKCFISVAIYFFNSILLLLLRIRAILRPAVPQQIRYTIRWRKTIRHWWTWRVVVMYHKDVFTVILTSYYFNFDPLMINNCHHPPDGLVTTRASKKMRR